jgi:hypothetical protein
LNNCGHLQCGTPTVEMFTERRIGCRYIHREKVHGKNLFDHVHSIECLLYHIPEEHVAIHVLLDIDRKAVKEENVVLQMGLEPATRKILVANRGEIAIRCRFHIYRLFSTLLIPASFRLQANWASVRLLCIPRQTPHTWRTRPNLPNSHRPPRL